MKMNRYFDGLLIDIYSPENNSRKPPIFAIHGSWSSSRRMENYGRFFSEKGYTFLAVNLRGHAASRLVKDLGKVSIKEYIQDIKDAIDYTRNNGTIGWVDPIVIGHSMGGLIAQKIAEEIPLSALILLNSAPPQGVRLIRSADLFLAQLKYFFCYLLMNRKFKPTRKDAYRFIMNGMPLEARDQYYQEIAYESGLASKEIALGRIEVGAAEIHCPILIVGCGKDKIIHPAIAQDLYEKYDVNKKATVRIFKDFAHWIQLEPGWEQPAKEILQWLEKLK